MQTEHFVLRNSVPINTIRISLALLGIFMLFAMPREQYPNVPLYYVHAVVPYPGATAYEVEKEITQKIEETLQSVDGLHGLSSIVSDGLSFTRLTFSQSLSDHDFQNRYRDVQSLISGLSFPENAEKPEVKNFTYLDFISIVNVVVSADLSAAQLMEYAQRAEANLKFVSGVLRIENKGLFARRITVQTNEAALRARGISIQEIQNAIRQSNVSIPGGTLRTSTQEHPIRIFSDISSINDVKNIIVREGADGTTILSDIAVVSEKYDTSAELVRFNGRNAVEFKIYKTGSADSISMVKEVKKRTAAMQKMFKEENQSIDISAFADTTENIRSTIKMLASNALIGFALVFLVLLLFLGLRPAAICAMEIPFTFAISFFVLKLLGITLNSSTLFALVLVLGMIVDHSIVILENITRIMHTGTRDRKTAVTEAVRGVAFPVITSALTTIGTFFPLIFMPGFIGKFLLPVPVTITVTLIVSTVSALVIIPLHYIELPGEDNTRDPVLFRHIRSAVRTALEFILRFKLQTAFGTAAVIAGIIIAVFFVPVSLYDTEEQPFFFVDVAMPSGTSMQLSDKVMKEMERRILSISKENKIRGVLTLIGNTDPDIAEGLRIDKPHNAQFQIEITSPSSRDAVPMNTVISRVHAALRTVPGADTIRIRKQRSGPPAVAALEYQLLGDDLEALASLDADIRKKLAGFSEIYNIRSNLQSKTPSLEIAVDPRKAAQYGLTPAYIGSTIRSLFADDAASSLFINNEQTDIVLSYSGGVSNAMQALMFLTFPTQDRTVVPLSAVADIKEKQNLTSIYRKDSRRQASISAEVYSRRRVKSINDDITAFAALRSLELKSPVEFKIGGEFEEFSNLLRDILLFFTISIVLVYVVLTAEFKSYFQPFLIIMAILFAAIGVGAYLLITGTALSISILYSFVALAGVVVNNAIVLVSTANEKFQTENITHHEAVIAAAQLRVKPILLTSFTTIIGLLPTALQLSGKSPIWQPMAATIAAGLGLSTAATVLILPVFYELFSKDKKQSSRTHAIKLSPSDLSASTPRYGAFFTGTGSRKTAAVADIDHNLKAAKKKSVRGSEPQPTSGTAVNAAKAYTMKIREIDEVAKALLESSDQNNKLLKNKKYR